MTAPVSRAALVHRKPYLITPTGLKLLKDYVANLKDKYLQTIKEIQIAKEHGDFSENAELKTARETKNLTKKALDEMEPILFAHQVSCAPPDTRIIRFGATISLLRIETNEPITITIGSSVDVILNNTSAASVNKQGKVISYGSDLGKALLAKTINDAVTVGDFTYTVQSIEYNE